MYFFLSTEAFKKTRSEGVWRRKECETARKTSLCGNATFPTAFGTCTILFLASTRSRSTRHWNDVIFTASSYSRQCRDVPRLLLVLGQKFPAVDEEERASNTKQVAHGTRQCNFCFRASYFCTCSKWKLSMLWSYWSSWRVFYIFSAGVCCVINNRNFCYWCIDKAFEIFKSSGAWHDADFDGIFNLL